MGLLELLLELVSVLVLDTSIISSLQTLQSQFID